MRLIKFLLKIQWWKNSEVVFGFYSRTSYFSWGETLADRQGRQLRFATVFFEYRFIVATEESVFVGVSVIGSPLKVESGWERKDSSASKRDRVSHSNEPPPIIKVGEIISWKWPRGTDEVVVEEFRVPKVGPSRIPVGVEEEGEVRINILPKLINNLPIPFINRVNIFVIDD